MLDLEQVQNLQKDICVRVWVWLGVRVCVGVRVNVRGRSSSGSALCGGVFSDV